MGPTFSILAASYFCHQLICVCGCASRLLFLGPTQVAVETWASVGLRPAPQPGDVGSQTHVSPAGSGESFPGCSGCCLEEVSRMWCRLFSLVECLPLCGLSGAGADAQNSSGCVGSSWEKWAFAGFRTCFPPTPGLLITSSSVT